MTFSTDSDTIRSILAWLGPNDYQEPLRRAHTKRTSGTGQWLVENPEFRFWRDNHEHEQLSRVLWIYGAPGVGKSVLCGTAIEYLQRGQNKVEVRGCTTVYFYCDSSNSAKRTAFDICVSLLYQLQSQNQQHSPTLRAARQNALLHGRSHVTDADDVYSLFQGTFSELQCSYIVIDALDECIDIAVAIDWLLQATTSIPTLRLLVISRETADIRRRLSHAPSVPLTTDTMKPDIETYLAKSVDCLPFESGQLRRHISTVLSHKADGMFLYASLGLQTLQQATNIEEALDMLQSTPSGVYHMYDLILKRLSSKSSCQRSLVQRIFRLLCTTTRPLTWSELKVALSWDEKEDSFYPTKAPFKDAVLALCYPLVGYGTGTDTCRLVHFSLREYLCNDHGARQSTPNSAHFYVDISQAQRELAGMTLAQIADDHVSLSITVSNHQYPFVAYATKNWCHHLSLSPYDTKLFRKYTDFAVSPDRRSVWILRWLLSEENSFPLQQVITIAKMAQEWLREAHLDTLSAMDTLSDVQRALFRLDDLPPTTPGLRVISNFERLISVRDLARELTKAGKLGQGIQMFEDALSQNSGKHYTVTLDSCWLLNSLGILYDQQGNTKLAHETQRKALEYQEQKLPSNHLDIVLTINELGRITTHLQHYQEAESLHRRALNILEAQFDERDLQIAWTKNALGRCLLKQNRPLEALSYHQHVLDVRVHRLGKDHPHTLWTMSDIVRCLRDLHRLDSAIDMQQELLDRSKSSLGLNNIDTLWSTNSLGLLFEAAMDFDMARKIQQTAWEGQIEILGENHPHCLWTRDVLHRLEDQKEHPTRKSFQAALDVQ